MCRAVLIHICFKTTLHIARDPRSHQVMTLRKSSEKLNCLESSNEIYHRKMEELEIVIIKKKSYSCGHESLSKRHDILRQTD